MRSTSTQPTDLRETPMALRLLPAVAYVLTLIGILIGNGVIGPDRGVGQEGSIAGTDTLLKPAGTAFSIWSVIYLFLLAYVIWHALAAGARSARARAALPPAVASLVLNMVWILAVQLFDSAWGSVAVMIALLASLIVLHRRLAASVSASRVEQAVLDVAFGLYLGWINVATLANVTFASVLTWPDVGFAIQTALAVLVLVAALGVAWFVLPRVSEPISVGAAMAWGLSWIAVERITNEPRSAFVAGVAIAVAVLIVALVVLTVVRRRKTAAA